MSMNAHSHSCKSSAVFSKIFVHNTFASSAFCVTSFKANELRFKICSKFAALNTDGCVVALGRTVVQLIRFYQR